MSSLSSNFTALRFRPGTTGGTTLEVFIGKDRRVKTRNYATSPATTKSSEARVSVGVWHSLEAHVDVDTPAIEIWLDGVPLPELVLATGEDLGGATRSVEIGNRVTTAVYQASFDNAGFDTSRLGGGPSPSPSTTPPPTEVEIAAAGNIACDPAQGTFNGGNGTASTCRQRYVSDLVTGTTFDAVLALGDTQYICAGFPGAYAQSYDPTWGRVFSKTYSVPGDKEYRNTTNAPDGTDCRPPGGQLGYERYFGGSPGFTDVQGGRPGYYYSFDLGSWHLVALNGSCGLAGGCGPGSPQYQWLAADLAANEATCTLAFWHQPRFSSGKHGSEPAYDAFWRLLYANDVELVLGAHEHTYERFAPQDPDQTQVADGIQQFVLGTGGHSHVKFPATAPEANSVVRNDDTFGVLGLTLRAGGYDWRFLPEAGKTFTDIGSRSCH